MSRSVFVIWIFAVGAFGASAFGEICSCAVCPQRMNDFCWENDKVGFRAYGPGEWHKWSGCDVFNKNTSENVCQKWLTGEIGGDFHTNRGQGMDNYTMGASRGVGGVAMYADGEWKTYPDWETSRILHTGDDYLEFELVYPAFSAAGKMTSHITLRRGERFYRNDVSFERMPDGFLCGPGLDLEPKRDHKGDLREEPGVVALFEDPKGERGGDGSAMSAVFVAPGVEVVPMTDHQNCRVLAFRGRRSFTYWAGAGWSLAGEITTPAAWHEAVRAFRARLQPCDSRIIAHRGESYDAPENTLPAYGTAVARGFGFECDIYLSKDNRLFTFHDNSLGRTTDGANTNLCTDVDWSETVSKVNVGGWGKWKGSRFDPTRPALFSEVLDLARDGRWIYVEVKGDDPSWIPFVREELARAGKANPGNVLFISFGERVCAELKRQMPDYRVYWLTRCTKPGPDGKEEARAPAEIVAKLRELGVDGVDIRYDPKIVDAAYVKAVRDAGFSFHVWTVDDPELARRALAAGVETLTTNRAKYICEAL